MKLALYRRTMGPPSTRHVLRECAMSAEAAGGPQVVHGGRSVDAAEFARAAVKIRERIRPAVRSATAARSV
jgi:hypothetical protein